LLTDIAQFPSSSVVSRNPKRSELRGEDSAGAATAVLAMILIAQSRVYTRSIETVEARYESRAMNHEWG
jgi:hypothetical protein